MPQTDARHEPPAPDPQPIPPPDAGAPSAPPTLTLQQIRSNVARELDAARSALAKARTERDQADNRVRVRLAEVEELERVHRQLNAKPRTVKRTPTEAST